MKKKSLTVIWQSKIAAFREAVAVAAVDVEAPVPAAEVALVPALP